MIRCIGPGGMRVDASSPEALELKAWIVILGTKVGENSHMLKLGGARRTTKSIQSHDNLRKITKHCYDML